MSDAEIDERDREEYELMMELDELESLKEEMEEMGVSSLSEIEVRVAELNRKLDGLQRGR
jgi:hypothetical protein